MAAVGAYVTGTLHDLSTLQILRMRSLIVCHARRDVPAPLQRGAQQGVAPFMWAGAGLAGAALLAPGPADAYETKSWMPRRHYRGMKEARTPPQFEVRQPQRQLCHAHRRTVTSLQSQFLQKSQIWGAKEEAGPVHDVKSTVQKMSGAVQDVFGGSEGVCSPSPDVLAQLIHCRNMKLLHAVL